MTNGCQLDKTKNDHFELGAEDSQLDFPVVYAIGRSSVAKTSLDEEFVNLDPLFDMILNHIPAATPMRSDDIFVAQPFNLAYDNFLGRIGEGSFYQGKMEPSVRNDDSQKIIPFRHFDFADDILQSY